MAIVKRSVVSAVSAAGMAGVFLFTGSNSAIAADCGHSWAKPGRYKISASFRGKNESTNAFLGKDCRISLQVPGVFTGGKVSKSGQCLEFSFKVEGETQVFRAKWCDDYGLVPWKDTCWRAPHRRPGRAALTRRQQAEEHRAGSDTLIARVARCTCNIGQVGDHRAAMRSCPLHL